MLVFEYVLGVTLGQLVRAEKGRLAVPLPVAAAIVVGALRGLEAAHTATNELGEPLHLVHRDISPQNIMIAADGTVRVIDFGIARALGRAEVTTGNELRGKAPYMAPERFRGQKSDHRIDLWSVGVVLWELVCGRKLFDSDDPIEAALMVCTGAVPQTGIDAVDLILERALARDVSARFATADEMVGGGLGLVGMLAGPLSKTANLAALKEAQSLLGNGERMGDIWKKTGWFQGPEGGWRYEITDKAASIENIPKSSYDANRLSFPMMEGLYKQPGIPNRTLGLTLDHPELYKAYPELQSIPVQGTGLNVGLLGSYDEEATKMFLAGGFPENVRSTALHEAQHAIQGIENTPRGGNTNMFLPSELLKSRDEISQTFYALKDVIQKDIPSFNYFTVYGALNKQARGKDLYEYEKHALDLVNNHPKSAEFYELLNKKMQLDNLEKEAVPPL